MRPKISQGVTAVVVGNCGISLAPFTFAGEPPPPLNLLGGRDAYQFPRFAAYAEAIANRRDPLFIVPAGGADICNIKVPVRRVVTGQ